MKTKAKLSDERSNVFLKLNSIFASLAWLLCTIASLLCNGRQADVPCKVPRTRNIASHLVEGVEQPAGSVENADAPGWRSAKHDYPVPRAVSDNLLQYLPAVHCTSLSWADHPIIWYTHEWALPWACMHICVRIYVPGTYQVFIIN